MNRGNMSQLDKNIAEVKYRVKMLMTECKYLKPDERDEDRDVVSAAEDVESEVEDLLNELEMFMGKIETIQKLTEEL